MPASHPILAVARVLGSGPHPLNDVVGFDAADSEATGFDLISDAVEDEGFHFPPIHLPAIS